MLVSVSYFLLINDTMNQREIEYIERIYIKLNNELFFRLIDIIHIRKKWFLEQIGNLEHLLTLHVNNNNEKKLINLI